MDTTGNAVPLNVGGEFGTATLQNAGTLIKRNANLAEISFDAVNDGTVSVQAGTLRLGGSVTSAAGTFLVAAGGVLQFQTAAPAAGQTLTFGAASRFAGAGDVQFLNTGMPVTIAGTFAMSGRTEINSAATVRFDGPLMAGTVVNGQGTMIVNSSAATIGSLTFGSTGGRTIINGALTVADRLDIVGADPLDGTGTTTVSGTFAVSQDRQGIKAGSGTLTINGLQENGTQSTLTVSAGAIVMNTDAGGTAHDRNLSLDIGPAGAAWVRASQHLRGFAVQGATKVDGIGGGAEPIVIVTNSLQAIGLDLVDNAIVVDHAEGDSGTPFSIRQYLEQGYSGGAWTGPGLQSSSAAAAAATPGAARTALGYAESDAVFGAFPANFLGEPVDNSAVLVRYTLYGDANLDGNVNINDFARLAAAFGAGNGKWFHGDFNYDGTTNINDFALLAANFGRSVTIDSPRGSSAPEPAAGAVLAAALLPRRRTRRRELAM